MGGVFLGEGYWLCFNPLAFWCPRFGFIRRLFPSLQLVNISLLGIPAPSCEMRPSRDGYYILSIYPRGPVLFPSSGVIALCHRRRGYSLARGRLTSTLVFDVLTEVTSRDQPFDLILQLSTFIGCMPGVPVEPAILAGIPLGFLISHRVRTPKGDLVFISQVYILPRLIELGVYSIHGEIPLPFLFLSSLSFEVTSFILFPLGWVLRGRFWCRWVRRG